MKRRVGAVLPGIRTSVHRCLRELLNGNRQQHHPADSVRTEDRRNPIETVLSGSTLYGMCPGGAGKLHRDGIAVVAGE
jgi:hypothetical protein